MLGYGDRARSHVHGWWRTVVSRLVVAISNVERASVQVKALIDLFCVMRAR